MLVQSLRKLSSGALRPLLSQVGRAGGVQSVRGPAAGRQQPAPPAEAVGGQGGSPDLWEELPACRAPGSAAFARTCYVLQQRACLEQRLASFGPSCLRRCLLSFRPSPSRLLPSCSPAPSLAGRRAAGGGRRRKSSRLLRRHQRRHRRRDCAGRGWPHPAPRRRLAGQPDGRQRGGQGSARPLPVPGARRQ